MAFAVPARLTAAAPHPGELVSVFGRDRAGGDLAHPARAGIEVQRARPRGGERPAAGEAEPPRDCSP